MYVMLVAHPGVGKTRTINEGRHYVQDLHEFHLAPISMTFASLVDSLVKSKRAIVLPGSDPLEYNSMFICVDEIGAFISKYENEMIDGLSHFYDPTPYQQVRRTSDINIKIKSPQINILCGSTPQNLTDLMPEKAWGQGFTSRLMMVFSDERAIADDFAEHENTFSEDLVYDIKQIYSLIGEVKVTAEFRELVQLWQKQGEAPVPNHPKLIHYVTRRRVHLYKLAIIASIDRSNAMILTREDFNIAMGWLLEAESTMIEIFKAGATNADAQAMDEIKHFILVNDRGKGVSEQKIVRFASERIPLHSILRVVEIMERSGQIKCIGQDRTTKARYYSAV